jgi:stage V sporulation protein S
MDRLFSKFNLGDIKVGEASSFPPDAESGDQPAQGGQLDQPAQSAAPVHGTQPQQATPAQADDVVAPPQRFDADADAGYGDYGDRDARDYVAPSPYQQPRQDPGAMAGGPAASLPAPAEDRVTAFRPVNGAASGVGARPYRPGYGQGQSESRGEVLKVSSRSRPSAVAGAIAGVVRESGRAEVQAIGAGAANQAIKAVAIARDYLQETGIEAVCLPSLVDLQIDEADRTAIRLVVETR